MSSISPHNAIVVQGWMVTDLGLSGDRLMVFAAIWGLSQASGRCRCPMSWLMGWTGKGKASVRRTVELLKGEGVLEAQGLPGGGYEYALSKAVRERYQMGFDEAEQPDFADPEFSSNRRSVAFVENSAPKTQTKENRRSEVGVEETSGGSKIDPVSKIDPLEETSGGSKIDPLEESSGVATKDAGESARSSSLRSSSAASGFTNPPQPKSFLQSAHKKERARVKSKDKDRDRDKRELQGRGGVKSAREEGSDSADDRIRREYFGMIRSHVVNGDYFASGLDCYRRLRDEGHSPAEVARALDELNVELSANLGSRPHRYWPQAKRLLSPDNPRGVRSRLARSRPGRPSAGTAWVAALDRADDLGRRAREVNDELVRLGDGDPARRDELLRAKSELLRECAGGAR